MSVGNFCATLFIYNSVIIFVKRPVITKVLLTAGSATPTLNVVYSLIIGFGPVSPVSPVSPVGPVGVSPVGPVGVSPVSPVGPVGVSPVSPVGPVGPVAPLTSVKVPFQPKSSGVNVLGGSTLLFINVSGFI